MSDCQKLEPLLTPYADGEVPAPEAGGIEAHLGKCPPCRWRVERERAVRGLLQGRRQTLAGGTVSPALRARCLALAAGTAHPAAASRLSGWPRRVVPLALAASLTLLVGGTFLYQATTRSSRVLAAELAADHIKCFAANRVLNLNTETSSAAQSYLASSFGWQTILPQIAGLNLEAARPCLYGEGRLAHVMYRYGGRPVSLFMLPGTTRRDEMVEVMGHEAAIWSEDGRTFVLIARESHEELERLAVAIHATLK